MPTDVHVGNLHGRDNSSSGTLWDQESHENAIKILVEEAKVNLCLRMMNDFKIWQYSRGGDPSQDETTTTTRATISCEGGLSEAAIEQKCHHFEEALGLLLTRSLAHVEALQLMDIPLLIEHIALVLNQCDIHRTDKLNCSPKEQEFVVMYYFSSLMKHSEALNSTEVMAKSRDFRLLPLAAAHVVLHATTEYNDTLRQEVAMGFAALCDNEDFRTSWATFFEGDDGQLDTTTCERFLRLQVLTDEIISKDPSKRRELRPLTDFFNVVQRRFS